MSDQHEKEYVKAMNRCIQQAALEKSDVKTLWKDLKIKEKLVYDGKGNDPLPQYLVKFYFEEENKIHNRPITTWPKEIAKGLNGNKTKLEALFEQFISKAIIPQEKRDIAALQAQQHAQRLAAAATMSANGTSSEQKRIDENNRIEEAYNQQHHQQLLKMMLCQNPHIQYLNQGIGNALQQQQQQGSQQQQHQYSQLQQQQHSQQQLQQQQSSGQQGNQAFNPSFYSYSYPLNGHNFGSGGNDVYSSMSGYQFVSPNASNGLYSSSANQFAFQPTNQTGLPQLQATHMYRNTTNPNEPTLFSSPYANNPTSLIQAQLAGQIGIVNPSNSSQFTYRVPQQSGLNEQVKNANVISATSNPYFTGGANTNFGGNPPFESYSNSLDSYQNAIAQAGAAANQTNFKTSQNQKAQISGTGQPNSQQQQQIHMQQQLQFAQQGQAQLPAQQTAQHQRQVQTQVAAQKGRQVQAQTNSIPPPTISGGQPSKQVNQAVSAKSSKLDQTIIAKSGVQATLQTNFPPSSNVQAKKQKSSGAGTSIEKQIVKQICAETEVSKSCICAQVPRLKSQVNQSPELLQCKNEGCGHKLHLSCMKILPNDEESISQFECPSCILRKYDPLHKVEETKVDSQIISNKNLEFILTPKEFARLSTGNDFALEVRCIRIDGSKNIYETTWPDFGIMKMNGEIVLELKPLQNNSSLKKRKDEKYTFKGMKCLKEGTNHLTIQEFQPNHQEKKEMRLTDNSIHCISIFLIRRLTTEQLIASIKQENVRPEQECRQQIQAYFRKSDPQNPIKTEQDDIDDDEIHIDSLSVPLACNLDMKLIQTPAKGRFCKHFQCFSLENFIITTETLTPRKWRCSICKAKCYDIIVDAYILQIINEINSKNIKNVTDVKFDHKGDYSFNQLPAQTGNNNDNDNDDDDDDDDDFEDSVMIKRNPQIPLNPQNVQNIPLSNDLSTKQKPMLSPNPLRPLQPTGQSSESLNPTQNKRKPQNMVIIDSDDDEANKAPPSVKQNIQSKSSQPQNVSILQNSSSNSSSNNNNNMNVQGYGNMQNNKFNGNINKSQINYHGLGQVANVSGNPIVDKTNQNQNTISKQTTPNSSIQKNAVSAGNDLLQNQSFQKDQQTSNTVANAVNQKNINSIIKPLNTDRDQSPNNILCKSKILTPSEEAQNYQNKLQTQQIQLNQQNVSTVSHQKNISLAPAYNVKDNNQQDLNKSSLQATAQKLQIPADSILHQSSSRQPYASTHNEADKLRISKQFQSAPRIVVPQGENQPISQSSQDNTSQIGILGIENKTISQKINQSNQGNATDSKSDDPTLRPDSIKNNRDMAILNEKKIQEIERSRLLNQQRLEVDENPYFTEYFEPVKNNSNKQDTEGNKLNIPKTSSNGLNQNENKLDTSSQKSASTSFSDILAKTQIHNILIYFPQFRQFSFPQNSHELEDSERDDGGGGDDDDKERGGEQEEEEKQEEEYNYCNKNYKTFGLQQDNFSFKRLKYNDKLKITINSSATEDSDQRSDSETSPLGERRYKTKQIYTSMDVEESNNLKVNKYTNNNTIKSSKQQNCHRPHQNMEDEPPLYKSSHHWHSSFQNLLIREHYDEELSETEDLPFEKTPTFNDLSDNFFKNRIVQKPSASQDASFIQFVSSTQNPEKRKMQSIQKILNLINTPCVCSQQTFGMIAQ